MTASLSLAYGNFPYRALSDFERRLLCCSCHTHSLLLQVAAVLVKSKKTLARAVGLCHKAKVIAVDCEGCNLSAEGKLCLIQVRFALWLQTHGMAHTFTS